MAAPFPEFWNSGHSALISATISANKNAGDTLAAVAYELFNDKGGTHSSTTIRNARLVAEAFDGLEWVRSDEPCLDEGWLQVSLTGMDNTGDASMVVQTTAYTALGTNRSLLLSDIPANCARFISAQIVIPGGAAQTAPMMRLVLVYDETSFPLGARTVYATGGGVIPEYRDPSSRRLTSASRIVASGLATVAIDERFYSYDGTPYLAPPHTPTLNQTSGSGALAVGESYIAVISQAVGIATVTTTKGNRAASPVAPATPTGEIFIGKVTVAYQGGGTSIINSGNVDQTAVVRGAYTLTAGSGLNIVIGSGHALFSVDTEGFSTSQSTIAATDNKSNHVFVLPDGTFSIVANTSDTPQPAAPSVGAIYLGCATASGGSISATVGITPPGNPVRAEQAITEYIMTLRYFVGLGGLAVANDLDYDYLPFDAILDSVMGFAGIAAAVGSTATMDIKTRPFTNVDLTTPGTTIYTSSGTWDRRPFFPGGVAFTQDDNALNTGSPIRRHEVRSFARGTMFAMACAAVTGANAPGDITLQLHFRRR